MSELLEGYSTDAGYDPTEDHIGPFYYRRDDAGWHYAFRVGKHNCNASGIVHGGVLMTFADFALCMEATDHYDGEDCLTVSFNCDFVAAAEEDSLIESRATVTRKTRSMAFVRGEVFTGDTVVMTYSAVVKRLYDKE